MEPTKFGRRREDQDRSRIGVGLVPTNSAFATQVRKAARDAGAEFVRIDLSDPSTMADRILVVDMSQGNPPAKLSNRVVAISDRPDLDCYEVIQPSQLRTRLRRTIRNLVEREQLRRRVSEEQQTLEMLNEIGYALSAQTSLAELLDKVLTHSRRALHADGGSIYLVDHDAKKVRFTCSQNDTIPFRANRLELALDESSLAGFVAVRGEALNIEDAYNLADDVPYKPNFRFDKDVGYRTRSMLLVPMNDRDGNVLGVLALINRKPIPGAPLISFEKVEVFKKNHAALARSIASQAAVAIENYNLYREIRSLFEGFVGAAVTAIEARDPSTGGHSHRVASLTTALARAAHETNDGPFSDVRFRERELLELHYAAMLHDFGKVGVREQVLLKAEKLYDWEMGAIEARFRVASMQVLLESIRDQLAAAAATAKLSELKRDLAIVRRLNRPNVRTHDVDIDELVRISQAWQLPDVGEPVLSPHEIKRLCIPIGSLDPGERREIEEHVTHTHNFLKIIPWTKDLRRIPELAFAHHEKLDGSGYPRGLKSDEIPFGAKLMTIADIFDALTASDRPYKSALAPAQAIGILRQEAQRGKIVSEAVELFAARRLWEGVIKLPA